MYRLLQKEINQLLPGAEFQQFKLIQTQQPNRSNCMYNIWLGLRADLILRESVGNILVVGEAEVSPGKQNLRKNSLHVMENTVCSKMGCYIFS